MSNYAWNLLHNNEWSKALPPVIKISLIIFKLECFHASKSFMKYIDEIWSCQKDSSMFFSLIDNRSITKQKIRMKIRKFWYC